MLGLERDTDGEIDLVLLVNIPIKTELLFLNYKAYALLAKIDTGTEGGD